MFLTKTLAIGLLTAPALATAAPPPATTSPKALTPFVASADPFAMQVQRSQAWLAFPGTNVGGWLLELRLPTNVFLLPNPIEAVVVFKNVSSAPLRLYLSTPGLPYMFSTSVFDAASKPVPMDDKERDHLEDGHAELGMFRDVPAGTSLGFSCELQHLYRFSRPGAYKLLATARWLPNRHWMPGPAPTPAATAPGAFTLLASKPATTS